jgi:hypothetical protein
VTSLGTPLSRPPSVHPISSGTLISPPTKSVAGFFASRRPQLFSPVRQPSGKARVVPFETQTDLGCGMAQMEQRHQGILKPISRFLTLQRNLHRSPRHHPAQRY